MVVVVVVVHLRLTTDVQLCSTVVVVVVVVVSHVKGVQIHQEHQRVIHLGIRHQRARTTNLGREITLGRKIGMCTTTEARRVG